MSVFGRRFVEHVDLNGDFNEPSRKKVFIERRRSVRQRLRVSLFPLVQPILEGESSGVSISAGG